MRSQLGSDERFSREDILFALDGLLNVVLGLCVLGLLISRYLIP